MRERQQESRHGRGSKHATTSHSCIYVPVAKASAFGSVRCSVLNAEPTGKGGRKSRTRIVCSPVCGRHDSKVSVQPWILIDVVLKHSVEHPALL